MNRILSLSFLKANWDHGKDYLDNFVPFVGEIINLRDSDPVSLHEVQKDFSSHFGFEIPQGTIKSLLNRLKVAGYLSKNKNTYVKNSKLDEFAIIKNRDDLSRKYNKFIQEFIDFSKSILNIEIVKNNAELALNSFIETNSKQIDTRFESPTNGKQNQEVIFALNKFIVYVSNNEPGLFEYLSCIVQGNMLAQALYITDDINNIKTKKIKGLDIYFDTQFLLRLLGFSGEILQKPCLELLSLINKHRIRKHYFEHTYLEIQHIVDAAYRIKRGETKQQGRGGAISGIINNHKSPSDIKLLNVQIENDLKKLGIVKLPPPDLTTPLSIDESKLKQTLIDIVGYRTSSEEAVNFDIDSLTAIYRIRKGRIGGSLEDCRALFVSTNYKISIAAEKFFNSEGSGFPICISDHSLANALWIKEPLPSPDLPKNIIISDCYSALKPSTKQWDNFLNVVDDLKQKGNISDYEYEYLKNYQLSSDFLMESTKGVDRDFCEGDIHDITKKLEHQYTKNLKDEIKSQKRSIGNLEVQLKSEQTYIQDKSRSLENELIRQRKAALASKISIKRKNISKVKKIADNSVFAIQLISGIISLLLFLYVFFISQDSQNKVLQAIYLLIFGTSALNAFSCRLFNFGIQFKKVQKYLSRIIYFNLYKN